MEQRHRLDSGLHDSPAKRDEYDQPRTDNEQRRGFLFIQEMHLASVSESNSLVEDLLGRFWMMMSFIDRSNEQVTDKPQQ